MQSALTRCIYVQLIVSLPMTPKYKGAVQKSIKASDSGVYSRSLRMSGATYNLQDSIRCGQQTYATADYRKHISPLTEVSNDVKKVCTVFSFKNASRKKTVLQSRLFSSCTTFVPHHVPPLTIIQHHIIVSHETK